ncbi:MAG: hypothetical protein QOJ16_4138 [Acidobacteriota bacterium]|jgi:hypothetical protein|nr:hypothetical protein [Acidobacteriota bacterium]
MRKTIGLLAMLSLLVPLAVYATALPGTSATPSTLDSAIAVSQILSPQELMTAAQPAARLDSFFKEMNSGSSGQFPLGKICSISCLPCANSCPPGQGSCAAILCP